MTCAEPTACENRECSPPGNASEASPSARILRRRWTSGHASSRVTHRSAAPVNEMRP